MALWHRKARRVSTENIDFKINIILWVLALIVGAGVAQFFYLINRIDSINTAQLETNRNSLTTSDNLNRRIYEFDRDLITLHNSFAEFYVNPDSHGELLEDRARVILNKETRLNAVIDSLATKTDCLVSSIPRLVYSEYVVHYGNDTEIKRIKARYKVDTPTLSAIILARSLELRVKSSTKSCYKNP